MNAVFELDKYKLRHSFGAASVSYDGVASLQRSVGLKLLEQANPEALSGTVLDLGCGTGFLTGKLLGFTNIERLIALDIAMPMLQTARQKLGEPDKLHYVCGDAESPVFGAGSVDAVVSNLALQWCRDLTGMFGGLYRTLKPGGFLIFSTFGPRTLGELKQAWAEVDDYPHVNEFYRESELKVCLAEAGFKDIIVRSEIYRPVYRSVLDLMKELKNMGAHNVSLGRNKKLTTKNQLARVIDAYPLSDEDRRPVATFEAFIVSARV